MQPFSTPEPTQPPVSAPEKTEYTESWEQDFMQTLYKKFAAIIGPLDQPLLEEIVAQCRDRFKDKKEISMLEIGAGAGRSLTFLVEGFGKDKQIHYRGLDVSAAQHTAFIENEKTFPENIHTEEYALSSWQDYDVKEKADIIIAQHSWYGIGSDPHYITKLDDAIKEGGIAFVMLSGAETISLLAWKSKGIDSFSAEDFDKALLTAGVPFERIMDASAPFTREDFVKDGRLTQKGIDLCGYLYKKELKGDEPEVIKLLEEAPEEAFKYPKFLFVIKK